MKKNEIVISEELIERIRAEALKHTIVVLNRETIVAIAKVFLSAVRNGDLDEALGVVGRGEMNIGDLAAHIGICKLLEVEGNVVDVIALRQEEEKDE